jgi:GTP-binding protein Era
MTAAPTRCGFVAILGAPNAGKSTLVNALAGQKVAIVTQKVQTTRAPLRGIAVHGNAQVIFIDTPGIFAPKRRLDKAMIGAAWAGARDADAVLLLVDAPDLSQQPAGLAAADTERIVEGLKAANRRAILVLNKADALRREELLPLAAKFDAVGVFDRIFMISALKGEGVADLLAHCASLMPQGPFLYPEDQAADIPLRLLAAEITREKLYLRLHDELPYASAVMTDSWKDLKDGSVRIDQTIKKIGELSRMELEKLFGRRVHLFLHTKVVEDWEDRPAHYREWGLEFPKDQ